MSEPVVAYNYHARAHLRELEDLRAEKRKNLPREEGNAYYDSTQDNARARMHEFEELQVEKKKNLLEEGIEYYDSTQIMRVLRGKPRL